MTPENSRLVNYAIVPVGEAAAVSTSATARYPADAVWADPDIEAAAESMRWAFENRDEAAEMGRRGARDIRRSHAPDVAGKAIEHCLLPAWNAVAERRSAPRGRDPAGWVRVAEGHSENADGVRRLLSLEPVPERREAGGVRRRARAALAALARVLRPYTSYQRQVDAALLGSVDELIKKIADLEAELNETRAGPAAERAALFAEIRRISARIEDESGALRQALEHPPTQSDPHH